MSKNLVILTLVVATVAACGGGTSTTSAPAVPAAPAAVASTALKAASPDQVMLFTSQSILAMLDFSSSEQTLVMSAPAMMACNTFSGV